MAATGVVFHRLAAQEYRRARNWYSRRSRPTAPRFVRAVNRAVEGILAHPERWPWYDGRHQWARVGRFPYLLIFRSLADGRVAVVAVAHTSRGAGYWHRRTT